MAGNLCDCCKKTDTFAVRRGECLVAQLCCCAHSGRLRAVWECTYLFYPLVCCVFGVVQEHAEFYAQMMVRKGLRSTIQPDGFVV